MGGINNPTARSLIAAFEQTLKQLGWAEKSLGLNVPFGLLNAADEVIE